ncbi:MAG: hypothetical protein ACE5G2_07900, partial [Candidatus Krumholzibacteriia bacterium]
EPSICAPGPASNTETALSATALDTSLSQLADEVKKTGKKVRELKRKLKTPKPPASEAEAEERKAAERLLLHAHAASKVSGRAPFHPPALKRHERLLAVRDAATRAAKKGGTGRSSIE